MFKNLHKTSIRTLKNLSNGGCCLATGSRTELRLPSADRVDTAQVSVTPNQVSTCPSHATPLKSLSLQPVIPKT